MTEREGGGDDFLSVNEAKSFFLLTRKYCISINCWQQKRGGKLVRGCGVALAFLYY